MSDVRVGQLWKSKHEWGEREDLCFVTRVSLEDGLCWLSMTLRSGTDGGWIPIGAHYVSWMTSRMDLVSDVS